MTHGDAATAIRREEAAVEARSAALAKELGLIDLTLTQVLFIVGLPWVGVAAKLGPSHVIFWLIAMAFFYVPSAVVVIHLNGAMPLEGGLYQWAKLGFNELIGFLVAWNLWLFAILNTSEAGLQVTQYLPYVIGRVQEDRKSTRLNSSHSQISYAVFCLKKKKNMNNTLGTHPVMSCLAVPAPTYPGTSDLLSV